MNIYFIATAAPKWMVVPMKCDTCLNSRPIISENGIHYVCCLSNKASANCLTGKRDQYIKRPSPPAPYQNKGGESDVVD